MPNKTIYVRDIDLPLWELAQANLGESVSALFAAFLRERAAMLDAFVHVLRLEPPNQESEKPRFAVMFAPVGPTGSGGPMQPHYVKGWEPLIRFLINMGFTPEAAKQLEVDLKEKSSVSVRMYVTRPVANASFYRLHLKPIRIDAGKQSWTKVNMIGQPLDHDTKQWSAMFHSLDKCLAVLSNCLGAPAVQLTAIRRMLSEGREVEFGGSGGNAQFIVREDQLMQMGLTAEE